MHGLSGKGLVIGDFVRSGNVWHDLAVDLGPGLVVWIVGPAEGIPWRQLHAFSPESMVAGRFH